MRKLNGVVIDIVAPEDPEVLWINPKESTNKSLGIFICEAGVWKDLTQALGNLVASHSSTIAALPTTYAAKSIENTVASHTESISGLDRRVTALEESNSDNTEPEETPGE